MHQQVKAIPKMSRTRGLKESALWIERMATRSTRLARKRRWLAGFLAFALLAIFARQGFADCPAEGWVQDEISFTAVEGDGIGGSGIFGTITGFGSLCVNGRRLFYEPEVALTVNGEPMNVAGLAVGQVIRAETIVRADALHASAIDVQHELKGPVTAIGEGFVEIMGERLLFGKDREVFRGGVVDELSIGTRLAVSGLRRPDGRLVVSRIDFAIEDGIDLLRGTGSEDEAGRVRVAGILLALKEDPDESGERSALRIGQGRQLVLGRWNTDARRFEVLRSSASPVAAETTRQVDVEGYVTRRREGESWVGELSFQTSADSTGMEIEVGDRVRVRGVQNRDDGRLRATSVQLVPEAQFLRSLDRTWRASPSLAPRGDERSGRKSLPDARPRRPRLDPMERTRRPERPDPPVRPEPRPDLIERRPTADRL
jgi:hypothetical protein